MSEALLVIMNPRRLPECLLSLEQMNVPKVWVKNYTERQLEEVVPEIIESSSYKHYVLVSDDVVASTNAFEAVVHGLRSGLEVVTGYCNLDVNSGFSSLTASPPREPYGEEATYDWVSLDAIPIDEYTRTWHPSFAMTGMSREMWARFPWRCFGGRDEVGWAADLDLSIRLHAEEVPIWAPRNAFMYHTKRVWTELDYRNPGRELKVDVEPASIVWDLT